LYPALLLLSAVFLLETHVFSQNTGDWQAAQYPVRSVRITSHFGESRGSHFHSGIDFAGAQPIYPISEGEIIFVRDQTEDPTRPVLGVGDYAILEHPSGYRSYYDHMASGTMPHSTGRAQIHESIGIMGNTGHSSGPHLHLTLEELSTGRIINPLLHLPYIRDIQKPKIHRFLFVIDGKPAYAIKNNSVFRYRGSFTLFSIAWDLRYHLDSRTAINPSTAFGIRRISITIDGNIFNTYTFDFLIPTEKGLSLPSLQTHPEIYGMPFNYRLGQFVPSGNSHRFEISAEDWAGNTTIEKFQVSFK